MAYISSSANRWYCVKETNYGVIPSLTSASRIPAVSMTIQQQSEKSQRRDKTGSRTWPGVPAGMRRQTAFELTSYMRDWPDTTHLPAQGPLFEAALGAPGLKWNGGSLTVGSGNTTLQFVGGHGLTPGQAVV